mgnify:CR=1 FL=1
MISKGKIKEFVRKESGKKISGEAIEKLKNFLDDELRKIVIKAAKMADYAGRVVIKKEDILTL